jgi:hypothetical protein
MPLPPVQAHHFIVLILILIFNKAASKACQQLIKHSADKQAAHIKEQFSS